MDGNRVGGLPRPVAGYGDSVGQPGAGEATSPCKRHADAAMGSRRGPCLGGRAERSSAA